MWAVDPRRFTSFADQAYTNAKGREVYANEYAMHFPHHEWPEGRGKRLSPNHNTVVKHGGIMGAYAGWERANWFAQAGDDTGDASTHTWGRNGPWFQRISEECKAVAEDVGVLDLPGFSRFELSGTGAAAWLIAQIAGGLPKVGRMNLAYFTDARGRILTEMSVMRFEEDRFLLITAATAEWHDFELLSATLPDGLILRNTTDDSSALIISGPQSRTLFAEISDADLTLPWLSHQQAKITSSSTLLARVSFAGELGWEVHAANADMPEIYAAILAAGAKPFGMYALNSLRLEKGYRTWKGDLSSDYTLLEAGLTRFIKLDKPEDFPGKAALASETRAKRFVTLLVEAGEEDAPYMATVWHGKTVVGEVTSGGWGHRIGKSIALAMLRADTPRDATLEVEIYGQRYPVTEHPNGAVYDTKNERLRA
jgi:dimethylglycine dehydrogenase